MTPQTDEIWTALARSMTDRQLYRFVANPRTSPWLPLSVLPYCRREAERRQLVRRAGACTCQCF